MNLEDLTDLDIGQQFIQIWRARGISELTEIQAMALSHPSLRQGESVITVAPTSSGKTFIGEVLAVRAASTLHRAIYLVPYKALAEEKYAEFVEKYANAGISVVVSSGDHAEYDADIRRGDFGIAVVVYEKLAQLLAQSPGILSDCHLLVVDEVQLIRDRNRGPLLELLLTRIKRLQPSPQIVCLSATVKTLGGFDSWLGARVVETKSRPVPLWEGIVEGTGAITLHNEADGQTRSTTLQLAAQAGDTEALIEELVKGLGPSEQLLVFRTQVDATERTAFRLAQALPVRPVPHDIRERIMLLEDSPARAFLNKYIERRVAYHNAGLSMEERRLVEEMFREGVLQVVVTTATLAAGVNLPADKVVIGDLRRYDPVRRTRVYIDVAEYKNCAGRAGRYGKRTAGTCLLLAENPGQTRILEQNYIRGDPPELKSAIPEHRDLARSVLGMIAEQIADTKSEIIELFRISFAFASHYGPQGLETEMVHALEAGTQQLLALGLVEEESGKLRVTPLGGVAARSGVQMGTFKVLQNLVGSAQLPVMSENDVLGQLTDVAEMQELRPFSPEHRAEVLSRWVHGDSVMRLATDYSGDYSVGHGRIRDLGEVAEWLLTTASQIGIAIGVPDTIIQRLTRLAEEAHFGVPVELVPLARLRILHRSDLLRLMFNDKGIRLTEPHQVLDAEMSSFSGILAPQKALALKEGIARSIGESLKRRRLGHLLRCDRLAAIRPLVERVYDTHGVDFDRAVEDLLNAPIVDLKAHRFTRQPSGQPDLELQGTRGTIVISAAASEDDKKPVSWDKSREVLGAVGYSGKASSFLVVGKPDFHGVARENAKELAAKGEAILLVPVDVLVELVLQKVEGKRSAGDVISKLEDTHGLLSREDIGPSP